jgi:hypothetical protein
MNTPETNEFHRVGKEWRGIPCPRLAVEFCQKMEVERNDARQKESLASQSLSIARQTIADQIGRIERLERRLIDAVRVGRKLAECANELSCKCDCGCDGRVPRRGPKCQWCEATDQLKAFAAGGGTVDQPRTNPLPAAGGDLRKEIFGILAYYQDSTECDCWSVHPIGACIKCDMEKLEDRISELLGLVGAP